MENKEEKFQELFGEYKRLVDSTYLHVQIGKPGQPYIANELKSDELMRRKELAVELVTNYQEFFHDKPAEWWDIQNDANH